MDTHILRSTTAIFDLLKNALDQYHAFKLQYITNNLVRRQEDGPDEEDVYSNGKKVQNRVVDFLCYFYRRFWRIILSGNYH